MKLIFLPVLFLSVIHFNGYCQFSSQEINRYKASAKKVTIIRDVYGVPHIYGKTDADAVFGLMYAQCEESFSRVEENILEMLGRLSEINGKDQLYNDLLMRLVYDSAAAYKDYINAPQYFRKLLDACADGVNFYLYKHPEVKPKVLKRFEPWYSLMRTDGSISATQTGGLSMRDMRSLYGNNDGTSYQEKIQPFGELEPTGSNGFAIAPSKSVSGHALLYINPHVTFYFRTEVQMVSEEGLNTYGAVTWSNFFVYQGFNEYCGWMHTSSNADVADLYKEKIEHRGDSLFYLLDGKLMPVRTKKININYTDNGSIKQQSFTTYATHHGPVLGSRDGYWLSLRENNRSMDALIQSWLRTKAKGFEEFKTIMNMRVNNSNNTVFADNKGNIAYWHGNFMPRRDSSFDYGLPVDGSVSASDWKGLHEMDEIVHVYNPASGWIQNCNSTPFTAAGASSPKMSDYPAYMAPDGQNFRGVNAARLLDQTGKLSMEGLIRDIGYSHYLSAFDQLLPPLFRAYTDLSISDSLKTQLYEAMSLLTRWDRNSSESSIATTLAIEWASRMATRASPPVHPYKATDALASVQSMITNTGSRQKLELLLETMNDLQKRFGNWKISWGEVNRYQRLESGSFDDRKPSMPVGLAPATWGSLPSFAARRFSQTDRRYGVSGNSFIACVEFGPKVRAKTISTGGQSFNPSSPHFTDQAEGYIQGQFKEVLFYKEEVLKHKERSYHPGE